MARISLAVSEHKGSISLSASEQQANKIALGAQEYVGSAYSPQIEVADTPEGHTVAITYKDAVAGVTTITFDVPDGAAGSQGPAGRDGVSPTVATTVISGGHRVTVTDASGTQTFDILDGQQGIQGPAGPQGPKGETYTLTAADKADIAQLVLDELPVAEGVGF